MHQPSSFRKLLAAVILAGALIPPVCRATPNDDMVAAAKNLLDALNTDQKAKAVYTFDDKERVNWHFIPRERKGLPLKEMAPEQRPLAMALLASGLSQRAFVKASTIMSLEQILKELESANPRMKRDPEMYFFTLFGTPGAAETWGWRLEGHHLAVNFTIVDGKIISGGPNFMGSNPAEAKSGPRKGLRVLAGEEDSGRALVKSLNAAQKQAAIFSTNAPKDIITVADRKGRHLDPAGIGYSKLSATQKELLMAVIKEYATRTRTEVATSDLERIKKAGYEKISFAWAGGLEPGEGHYYRVQGPTFLLEYDNTQNDNNHVHAVWRDLENDFGDDPLVKHYQQNTHK